MRRSVCEPIICKQVGIEEPMVWTICYGTNIDNNLIPIKYQCGSSVKKLYAKLNNKKG